MWDVNGHQLMLLGHAYDAIPAPRLHRFVRCGENGMAVQNSRLIAPFIYSDLAAMNCVEAGARFGRQLEELRAEANQPRSEITDIQCDFLVPLPSRAAHYTLTQRRSF